MTYFHWIAGSLLALAWFSRIVGAAIGMPKVTDVALPEWDKNPVTPQGNPRVSIIVPACNEEETIEQGLTQLLALDYDNYEIIAVDDRSTDRTGEIMDRLAAGAVAHGRLRVIHVETLPSGWLGKTHAMWTATNQASGDWLLFTDADVLFKPDALRRALVYAESERADHVVLFPRMIMKRPGEKMMIAFFQTLFVFGHRPWKVAEPDTKDHMGVGAFNMIRRSVYEAIGTYHALRFEVLDDMKLGKVVKTAGYAQRNVFGEDLISIRWAKGALGVVRNLTKNFFAVMSFQWPRAPDLLLRAGLPEPDALHRSVGGARMGETPLRDRAALDVSHLFRHVLHVRSAFLLFLPSSSKHAAIRLHDAAFNDGDALARRRDLARHEVSIRRTQERTGVGEYRVNSGVHPGVTRYPVLGTLNFSILHRHRVHWLLRRNRRRLPFLRGFTRGFGVNAARAEMTALFNVVVLGQRWNARSVAA